MNQSKYDYFNPSVTKLEPKDLIMKSSTEILHGSVDKSFGGRETVRFEFQNAGPSYS